MQTVKKRKQKKEPPRKPAFSGSDLIALSRSMISDAMLIQTVWQTKGYPDQTGKASWRIKQPSFADTPEERVKGYKEFMSRKTARLSAEDADLICEIRGALAFLEAKHLHPYPVEFNHQSEFMKETAIGAWREFNEKLGFSLRTCKTGREALLAVIASALSRCYLQNESIRKAFTASDKGSKNRKAGWDMMQTQARKDLFDKAWGEFYRSDDTKPWKSISLEARTHVFKEFGAGAPALTTMKAWQSRAAKKCGAKSR